MNFLEDLREQWGEDADGILRDLAHHGAEGGFPGLTYYVDTTRLYNEHEDEIWQALDDDARDLGNDSPLALIATFGGADNVASQIGFANLLVWYMAERVAQATLGFSDL